MKIYLLLFVSSLAAASSAASTYKDENFALSMHKKEGKTVLHFEGLIRPPFAEVLSRTLGQLAENGEEVELSLDSVGGSIFETMKAIENIKEFRKRLSFNTVVSHGYMCASSCVPLFVQGEQRSASSTSAFMFHGVASFVVTNIPDPELSELMIRIYLERGISKKWIERHRNAGVWSLPGETWYNGRELYEDGQGFVTKLLSRRIRFEPYDRSFSQRPR